MEYRLIQNYEIDEIIELDRKESIENIYYLDNGKLEIKEDKKIMEWSRVTYREVVNELKQLFFRGGTIFGAFDCDILVGIAALDNKFMGSEKNQLQLTLLQVDKSYRGQGIGRKLMELIKDRAKELGAETIYISASNSKNTVDFYLSIGCKIASEIDNKLFQLQPKDIHLELEV